MLDLYKVYHGTWMWHSATIRAVYTICVSTWNLSRYCRIFCKFRFNPFSLFSHYFPYTIHFHNCELKFKRFAPVLSVFLYIVIPFFSLIFLARVSFHLFTSSMRFSLFRFKVSCYICKLNQSTLAACEPVGVKLLTSWS